MSTTCEVKELSESFPQSSQDSRSSDQELRERYEEQQRRLACPACGEEPFLD